MGIATLTKVVRFNQSGVTLVEMIIAIIIISIALTALMSSWSSHISGSADPLIQQKALNLAQLYLDEILAQRFDEDTPVNGGQITAGIDCPASASASTEETGRTHYDDVDDYHGLSDSPPRDINGNALATYASYRVDVTISCISGQFGIAANNQIKRIDVVVSAPTVVNAMALSVYKANF